MGISEVSIIVPMRNEEKYIAQCLESIASQDYPQECMEVLVVDGCSTDGSRAIVLEWMKTHPNVTLLDNPNRTAPYALNIGISHSVGKYIIRMDAHTFYAKDYVSKCVHFLKETDADNVGGPMRAIGQGFWSTAIAAATSSPFGVGNAKFHYASRAEFVDTVYLGAFRREIFERVGLFDVELTRNQDDEMNFRIRKSGGKIFCTPEIKSYYVPRDSLLRLWKQYFQYGFWKALVLKKHRGLASWRSFVPLVFVNIIIITGLLSIVSSMFLKLFIMVLTAYFTASLIFSLAIARKWSKTVLFPAVTAVFLTLHFSYGVGFGLGIPYFALIWKRAE